MVPNLSTKNLVICILILFTGLTFALTTLHLRLSSDFKLMVDLVAWMKACTYLRYTYVAIVLDMSGNLVQIHSLSLDSASVHWRTREGRTTDV